MAQAAVKPKKRAYKPRKRVLKPRKKPVLVDDTVPVFYPDDPELNEMVIKMAKKLYDDSKGHSAACVIYRNKEGKLKERSYYAGPCYQSFPDLHPRYEDYWGKRKPLDVPALAVLSYDMLNLKNYEKWENIPEATREYITWATTESPYSKAFLKPNPVWMASNAAVYDMQYSSQYALGAGMQLRYVYEFPRWVEFWAAMKDIVTPELALVLAQWEVYSFDDKKKIKHWKTPGYDNSGHAIFTGELQLRGLRRYLSHNISEEKKLPRLSETISINYFMRVWQRDDLFDIRWEYPHKIYKGADSLGRESTYHGFTNETLHEWLPEFVTLNSLEDVIDVKAKKCLHHKQ